MPVIDLVRAQSTYRVAFDGACVDGRVEDLARRIADIIHEMEPVEIRVDAEATFVAYVLVPADVMPEAIDRKADALRTKWAAPAPAPKES